MKESLRRYRAIILLLLLAILLSLARGEGLTAPTPPSAPGNAAWGALVNGADPALPEQFSRDNALRFEHLSLEEGLSQSVVLDIIQDSRGFLWIATQDGLNRYDGYDFVVYKQDPEESNSLSNSFITSVVEDAAGALWIGTSGGGINRYDPERETFSHFRHDPDDPATIGSNAVVDLAFDPEGALWVATTGGGLNRLEPDGSRFVRYRHE